VVRDGPRSRRAIGVELDLARPDTVEDALHQARTAFGNIDVLVLNGGGPPPGPAAELTPQSLVGSMETLLLAQVGLVAAVLPAMRERARERSRDRVQRRPTADREPRPIQHRAPAAHLKTLAGEVAKDGVTVNMILPGRTAPPDEFAHVAAFLCSARASYVTGSHVRVDGGLITGSDRSWMITGSDRPWSGDDTDRIPVVSEPVTGDASSERAMTVRPPICWRLRPGSR
jgi:3-oxoacyl-[acyl-carrier protein] reductase